MKPRQVHVRINRVVIERSPGQSAAQVSRDFEQALPQAIRDRLARGAKNRERGASTDLREPIADAVAARVQPYLPTR